MEWLIKAFLEPLANAVLEFFRQLRIEQVLKESGAFEVNEEALKTELKRMESANAAGAEAKSVVSTISDPALIELLSGKIGSGRTAKR